MMKARNTLLAFALFALAVYLSLIFGFANPRVPVTLASIPSRTLFVVIVLAGCRIIDAPPIMLPKPRLRQAVGVFIAFCVAATAIAAAAADLFGY